MIHSTTDSVPRFLSGINSPPKKLSPFRDHLLPSVSTFSRTSPLHVSFALENSSCEREGLITGCETLARAPIIHFGFPGGIGGGGRKALYVEFWLWKEVSLGGAGRGSLRLN